VREKKEIEWGICVLTADFNVPKPNSGELVANLRKGVCAV
jgi:hypothetical protein